MNLVLYIFTNVLNIQKTNRKTSQFRSRCWIRGTALMLLGNLDSVNCLTFDHQSKDQIKIFVP